MAETTGISWATATWNPWQGCHKVSEACKFCYMYRDKARYGQDPNTVVRSAPATFNKPLTCKTEGFAPGGRVFTCSWSDWFIEEADAWRPEAWEIIRRRPDLVFMILTKRPERIVECLPPDWGAGWPNVWLGVTAENQQRADERIPLLMEVPAKVRFLSCEPLLGPVDLMWHLWQRMPISEIPGHALNDGCADAIKPRNGIHWVITGGESGPNARPSHPDWFRSLRDQCQTAGITFHFKQFGEWGPLPDSGNMAWFNREYVTFHRADECPESVWRIGTKNTGRLLDEILWDQIPHQS